MNIKKPAPFLTVTTIQSDLHWEDKQTNLDMFARKIDSVKEKMEIVILPEMFNTGFSMCPEKLAEKMNGATVTWMRNIAAAKRIIITGSLIIEEAGKYYNRLIWMLPDGKFGYYDKRHLFGFAGEDKLFTAGSKRMIASVKGWKINLQVCYDLRFPVWARQSNRFELLPEETKESEAAEQALQPEYDLLIYVANWPERRSHAWKTLLQARAIENQCYVAGINRVGDDGNHVYHSGDSMIVDPLGEIVYTASGKEDVHTETLSFETLTEMRNRFPFLRDADTFILGG